MAEAVEASSRSASSLQACGGSSMTNYTITQHKLRPALLGSGALVGTGLVLQTHMMWHSLLDTCSSCISTVQVGYQRMTRDTSKPLCRTVPTSLWQMCCRLQKSCQPVQLERQKQFVLHSCFWAIAAGNAGHQQQGNMQRKLNNCRAGETTLSMSHVTMVPSPHAAATSLAAGQSAVGATAKLWIMGGFASLGSEALAAPEQVRFCRNVRQLANHMLLSAAY